MRRRHSSSLASWTGWCLTAIAATFVPASLLVAQVQFSVRPTEVNLERYDFIEKCDAGIKRIEYEDKTKIGIFEDTVKWSQSESQTSLSTAAVEFAKRCTAHWPVASVSPNDTVYTTLMRLYLAANRDADAEELAKRRIVLNKGNDSIRAFSMFNDVLTVYMQSRPVRIAAIHKIIQEMEAPVATLSLERQIMFWGAAIQNYHQSVGDTVLLEQLGNRVLLLAEKLKKSGAQELKPAARSVLYFVYDFMTRHEQYDSLSRSTNAYIAIRKNNSRLASGDENDIVSMTGKRAIPIYGDFWFLPPSRVNDTSLKMIQKPFSIFPASGKVSLIVFLDHGCVDASYRDSRRGPCHSTYAVLRRLKKKYPELDMIVVSQTRGYYLEGPAPLQPADEADWLRKGFVFEGLDAIVSVTNTPFWHLEAADRRRINDLTENIKNYMYGEPNTLFPNQNLFLIDENGLLISKVTATVMRRSEMGLDARIGALMRRVGQGAKTSSATE